MANQTYRNIRRLNRIVVTLIRYGFGSLARDLRIFPPFFSALERIFVSKKAQGLSTPVRVRLVLEELGPTFIKLGQGDFGNGTDTTRCMGFGCETRQVDD